MQRVADAEVAAAEARRLEGERVATERAALAAQAAEEQRIVLAAAAEAKVAEDQRAVAAAVAASGGERAADSLSPLATFQQPAGMSQSRPRKRFCSPFQYLQFHKLSRCLFWLPNYSSSIAELVSSKKKGVVCTSKFDYEK